MNRLALAMIVKNEEERIGHCLEAVRGNVILRMTVGFIFVPWPASRGFTYLLLYYS